jgi:hypothetical protein
MSAAGSIIYFQGKRYCYVSRLPDRMSLTKNRYKLTIFWSTTRDLNYYSNGVIIF